jgi:hypothetical protein
MQYCINLRTAKSHIDARRTLARMMRIPFILTSLLLVACANNEYQFERIDGPQATTLPFKFDGIRGVRDGASVNAEARFTDGADFLTMNIALYLVPPPEFRAGRYEGTVRGKMIKGQVDCPSITFFGGQSDPPSVGGVFILKDEQNRPVYRVRIPATPMSRR